MPTTEMIAKRKAEDIDWLLNDSLPGEMIYLKSQKSDARGFPEKSGTAFKIRERDKFSVYDLDLKTGKLSNKKEMTPIEILEKWWID